MTCTGSRAKWLTGGGPLERRVRQLFETSADADDYHNYFGAEAGRRLAALEVASSFVSH